MRPIAKPILALAAILLAILLVVVLCLNLYLQSQGVQERLKNQLSLIAGVPVEIRGSYVLPSIPFLPLGGISLRGVRAATNGKPPLFTADSITLRPDYSELLQGRLVIDKMELNHPSLRLSTGEEFTGLKQPVSTEVSVTGVSRSGESFGTAAKGSPDTLRIPSAEAPTPGQPGPASAHPPGMLPFHGISVSHGEFTLLDAHGLPALSFSGITLVGAQKEAGGWIGDVKSDQAVLGRSLTIRDLHAPLSLSGDLKSLSLSPLTASLGGGKLGGGALFDLSLSAPRYDLALNLAGASLKQLLADASFGSSSAEGSIGGEIQLSGTAGVGASINGKGALLCKEAVIQPVDFLKQIGQLLNVEELKLLRLAEGKCLFQVNGGRVVIDDLFLRSENLILAAKGPLLSSGELDLNSRLLFNEKLTGRLRGLLGSQLSAAPEPGYTQVSFHVSGSAMSPKTDLLERLTGLRIGGDLGGLGGLLQGLFGRPSAPPKTPPQAPPAGGTH